MADEYTPTTDRRFTVRYVDAQQESGPHRPAMPAHWVIEDGLTVVARLVDIHVHDLAARDRAVAVKALREAADEFDGGVGVVDLDDALRTHGTPWTDADVQAAHENAGALMDWLRARADEIEGATE